MRKRGWSQALEGGEVGWSSGVAGGVVSWSSGVAGGEMGWITFFDARVYVIVEEVDTSTLDTKLGGTMGEGVD